MQTKWGQKALDCVFDVVRGKSRPSVPLGELGDEDKAYILSRLSQQVSQPTHCRPSIT